MSDNFLNSLSDARPRWIVYLLWLVFLVGLIEGLVGIFDVPPLQRRLALTFLVATGGVVILGTSLLPRNKLKYRSRDRWITLGMIIIATGGLSWLTYQAQAYRPRAMLELDTVLFQVRVQSKATANKIADAEVTLVLIGTPPLRDTTDVNGLASFNIDHLDAEQLTRVIVHAVGYKKLELEKNLEEERLPVIVELSPAQ